MNKIAIIGIFLIGTLTSYAQNDNNIETIRVDLNNNGIIDVIKPLNSYLEVKIDNRTYNISYENDFGFENIGELEYKNKVITISSQSQGTGLWTYTYKFRFNKSKNKIELIGYEDFNKWASGSMTTSINLATGKYEVKVEEWNEQKQDHDLKSYEGKNFFKKIYLEEIRQTDLSKLNEFGLQFTN